VFEFLRLYDIRFFRARLYYVSLRNVVFIIRSKIAECLKKMSLTIRIHVYGTVNNVIFYYTRLIVVDS